jgi:hypothetical protein
MELSEFFKTKALKELGEDDLKRKQSLEQLREWIKKQTHMRNNLLGMKMQNYR